jgi:protein-disulfide isomerase
VHKTKTLNIGKPDGIQAFLAAQKMSFSDVNKVITAMTSTRMNTRIAAAKSAANEYKLIGTPTLVVENKYLVSATEAGSTAKVVEATKKVLLEIKACR